MTEEVFKQIKNLSTILNKVPLEGFVKAVWVFGSFLKNKSGANDIDVLVIIDDTDKNYLEKEQKLSKILNSTTKNSNLNLHFQKPVYLSLLWSLIIKGEPWIITAINSAKPIYDPFNYLKLLGRLIKKKGDLQRDIKSERLVGRAEDFLTDNRGLMVGIIEELFFACFECAQTYLLLKDKTTYKSRKAMKELKKQNLDTDIFFEILNLNEKANKGALSEFNGEDVDYYTEKAIYFILSLRKLCSEELKKQTTKNKKKTVKIFNLKKDQLNNEEKLEQILFKIINKYKKEIISITLEEDRIILITNARSREINNYCKKFKSNFKIFSFQNYLGKIMEGDKILYSNLSKSEIVYDPGRFLDPLQELAQDGRIITEEKNIMKKFDSIKGYFNKIGMIKIKVLDNIYNSIIDLSQALLIERKNIYTIPKETAQHLKDHAFKTGLIGKWEYEFAKKVIQTYKQIEHKKIEMISGKELDNLQKGAEIYKEKIIRLLEP